MRWVVAMLVVALISCTNASVDKQNEQQDSIVETGQRAITSTKVESTLDASSRPSEGLFVVNFNTSTIEVFQDAALQKRMGLLDLNRGQALLQDQHGTNTPLWFIHPTEYNEGVFLATDWNDSSACVKFELPTDTLSYWLPVASNSMETSHSNRLILWSTFLTQRTLWIEDSIIDQNGIFSKPSLQSKRIVFKPNYPIYMADSVINNWIRIKGLQSVNGVYGSDTFTESLGWFRWYHDAEWQLKFPDFYSLEDFYSQH